MQFLLILPTHTIEKQKKKYINLICSILKNNVTHDL